eukprot:21085-Heterococcus_DN1.PRE.4
MLCFVTRVLLQVILDVSDTLLTTDYAYQQLYKPTHKPSKCGYSRRIRCYTQYCYYNAVCAPYAKAAVDFAYGSNSGQARAYGATGHSRAHFNQRATCARDKKPCLRITPLWVCSGHQGKYLFDHVTSNV